MDSMINLARAFVEQYAQEAVDALEELPATEAGALIGALPAESAVELLGHMPAPRAADCLAEMTPARALAAVRSLAPNPAADILRRLPDARREQILSGLARWRRVQIELVLRQPRQTVGAWMDTRIAAARAASTVGEALRRLPVDNTHGWLFVTGAGRRLTGAVRIGTLAQASAETRIEALVQPAPPALRTNATVSAALTHSGWSNHDILPVVGAGSQLVGAISHASLRRASTATRHATVTNNQSGTMIDIANAIYLGMAEVMNATFARKSNDKSAAGGVTRHE